jgi:hypothetical protein
MQELVVLWLFVGVPLSFAAAEPKAGGMQSQWLLLDTGSVRR